MLSCFDYIIIRIKLYSCSMMLCVINDWINELYFQAIQKRAIMIISGANDCKFYCSLYDLEQVNTRLDTLTRNFYAKILQPNDCLHKLLPRRELEHVQKLRTFKNFDLFCRTSRFQNSFLPYAFRKYWLLTFT